MIKEIVEAVSIPVMAKVRIGHFVEAQVMVPLITSENKLATHKLNSRSTLTSLHRYYKALGLTTLMSRKY
jgi:tRNA-dihydrouridine synthase